jgi:DNA-binding transcriptional LysR family regulator
MSDRLYILRLFTRVARTGSFSQAGRELDLSQSSVSRIIAALEAEVGVALLTRTTRAVVLTEAGAEYLARVDPILAALEEADHLAHGTGESRGVLRVALPSSFAVREVIPRLLAFLKGASGEPRFHPNSSHSRPPSSAEWVVVGDAAGEGADRGLEFRPGAGGGVAGQLSIELRQCSLLAGGHHRRGDPAQREFLTLQPG